MNSGDDAPEAFAAEAEATAVVARADGSWDVRYEHTPADAARTRELPPFTFLAVLRMILYQFGLPLLPSVLILLGIGLHGLAGVLLGGFVCLSLYGAWKAERYSLAPGSVELRLRPDYLEISNEHSVSRRGWSLYESVEQTKSFLYLTGRREPLVDAAPRRVFTAAEEAAVVAAMRSRIAAAAGEPAAPVPRVEGDFLYTSEFTYTADETQRLSDDMPDYLQLSAMPHQGDSAPAAGQRQSGCFTTSLLLMMSAAGFVSLTPGTNAYKIILWCGICAAIWSPRLIWLWMKRFGDRQQLSSAREAMASPRQHGVGPAGFTDVTAEGQAIQHWPKISHVFDVAAFLVVVCDDGLVYATPKRAMDDTEQFAATAMAFWREARTSREPAEEDNGEEAASPPGPAFESGNPYQPPQGE